MQSTLAQFNETRATEAFSLQNAKLLKVRLDQVTVEARAGAMVAYQGEVSLEAAADGSGLQRVRGEGQAFLAWRAQDVHLLKLEAETITVVPSCLLAYDAGISREPGPYGTVMQGTGFLAVVSHGPPVLLDVAAGPTGAGVGAAIVWSENVEVTAEPGDRDGAAERIALAGQGWALVQPSRGPTPGA
jgi:uncharacterized protein (AIM24 family)